MRTLTVSLYMKKRLIATENGSLETVPDKGNMIALKLLDANDVKNDTCPQCKYSPLHEESSFIICKNCNAKYKIIDGHVYIV